MAPPSFKKLIVTADDFGLAPEVNEAVIRAHREGILTSASLMVGAPAAAQAVRLAKENPGLKVGLHLVLVQGNAVLPPARIADIVDGEGRFSDAVAWSGIRYFFSPRARRQVAAECEAQVERFLSHGLPIDHIDGHTNLHIHPTILGILIDLAKKYSIPAVRVPAQPWKTLRASQAATALVMAPWVALMRLRLKAAGILANDELFGLFESGGMTEEAWLRIIPRIREGVTEVYCHPATRTDGILREHMPQYRHADELKALLSPEVRRRLEASGVELASFGALAEAPRPCNATIAGN